MKNYLTRFVIVVSFFWMSSLSFLNAEGSTADSIRKILFKTDNAVEQVKLYLSLSALTQDRNPDSATLCLRNALNLANSLKLLSPLGEVYNAMGKYAVKQNKLDQALHDFRLALTFFDKAQNPEQYARMFLYIGSIYLMNDDLSKAMTTLEEGILICEKNKLKLLVAHFYNNMGLIYQESNDQQNSLNYLLMAIHNFRAGGDSVEMANPILNLGWIYYDMGNYEMAMNYAERARNIFAKSQEKLREALAIMLLGTIKSRQGDFKSAIDLMNQSWSIQNESGGKYKGPKNYYLSELYIRTGIVYADNSNFDKAKSYLRKGLHLASMQNQPKLVVLALENLSEIYEKCKNADSALYFHKLFYQKSDSLSRTMSVNTINLVKIRQDFEKKQKEDELKLGFERSKRKNILIIYIISGVILLAVIMILFLMLKLEKQKEKQAKIEKDAVDEKLEFQNKEMTTNVMYLNKMNEQVVQIAEKLKNFQIEEGSNNAKLIRSIINDLEQGSGSVTWKEFEVRFQNVHKDFYKNLIEKYPDLTPNELKLCAFLRLNMSTKDISAITYQSENSITVARTRLRQKLGISRQDNLIAHLAQF